MRALHVGVVCAVRFIYMLERSKDKRRRNRKQARARTKALKKEPPLPPLGSLEFYVFLWKRFLNLPRKIKLLVYICIAMGAIMMWLGPLKEPTQRTAQLVMNTMDFRPWLKPVFEWLYVKLAFFFTKWTLLIFTIAMLPFVDWWKIIKKVA